LINVPPADQAGFAVTREVGGHHLVSVKSRAEAAIAPDKAVGLRIGVDVARLVNHLVDGDALDSGRQTQSPGLDDVRCLFVQADHEAGIVHWTAGVMRRRSVGLVDPDGLVQTVLLHRLAKNAGDVVDRMGLEVDVQGDDVEIVIVLRSRRVLDGDFQKPLKILSSAINPVPPVGQPRQVDDAVGVGFFGCQIGYLEQLVVVLQRAGPSISDVFPVPDIGLVPDDPVVNTARVVAHYSPDERCPQVIGIVVGQVETTGHAAKRLAIGGPIGSVLEQTHHFPSLGSLPVQDLVGEVLVVPIL